MASQCVGNGECIAAFIPALELLITEAMDEWKIPGLAVAARSPRQDRLTAVSLADPDHVQSICRSYAGRRREHRPAAPRPVVCRSRTSFQRISGDGARIGFRAPLLDENDAKPPRVTYLGAGLPYDRVAQMRELAVSLREVTGGTVRTICALETTEEQKRFVAPNALSIAQAYFEPATSFRAIYAGEMPVGFLMWRPSVAQTRVISGDL